MNGVITEVLDPNMYYSRLSFLESGKDALGIKHALIQGKRVGFAAHKLPKISEKYYTRSSMNKNFFGTSDVGSVRARYSDNFDSFKASLNDKAIRYRQKKKAQEELMARL